MSEKSLIIGDLHYQNSRVEAIHTAEDSILKKIKGKKFDRIILLGDLFHTKPSASERELLAQFISKLRRYTKRFDFIIGNGKHTFENNAIHEKDWMTLCSDFHQHEELTLGKYVFGHYEVKGTKYINGYLSDSKKEVDKDLIYVLGHVHSPRCSFDNVHYVGSIYKVSLSEETDVKRIAVIENDELSFIDIETRPMYQVNLKAINSKIKSSNIKTLLESKDKDIDLKIQVISDDVSISAVYTFIQKLKKKYNVEYYKEDLQLISEKQEVPEYLDREKLLKKYCKDKNINYDLITSELEKK